jgi:hypothetical protein
MTPKFEETQEDLEDTVSPAADQQDHNNTTPPAAGTLQPDVAREDAPSAIRTALTTGQNLILLLKPASSRDSSTPAIKIKTVAATMSLNEVLSELKGAPDNVRDLCLKLFSENIHLTISLLKI